MVWEYTLPRTERKPEYSWGVVRSDCSAPCAGGKAGSMLPHNRDANLSMSSNLIEF